MPSVSTFLLQLLMVVLVGGIIGAEREYHSKSAGFRTMILICLGSFLFTIFSIHITNGTPDRIASNIVTGIGFIGAGVIFKSDNRINGITTAGKVVNGNIKRVNEKVYVYNDGEREIKIEGDEYKVKDGDSKTKIDGDEYKYEDDYVTIKREGGEYKMERKGYTKKVDEDGDIKIETKDTKIKIDGETGERKVKKKTVFSKIKDKVTGQ